MTGDAPVPLPDASFPTGLLIALIVLVFLSGFFSAAETAFTSVNKIKLRTLAGNGNSRAKNVLSLAENKYDKLISVLLVGNNIVNLTASTLSVLFFQKILPASANYSIVSTVVITVTVLIFSEITPKYIAKTFTY